ncbi:MAG TPA: metallophosphoesterase, partial [Nevskiaceae bacterium]|nr:metallophosphoesterase [Nevskiaceae bacterium]
MSFYAIGDVQGCHAELCHLLDLIGFSSDHDRLWLVGDLVNRGPDSLAVLREVKALGNAAVTVLGNHDFHLLTIAHGLRRAHREDTLQPILDAPDRDELVEWLQHRPLVAIE